MGTHFRPPRQNDIDHWKAIEMLYEAGVRFDVFDPHLHYWTQEYKKRMPDEEMSPFELRQVLFENALRERYQPWSNQWPGPRPTHPREVPAFLAWWGQQELKRLSIVLEVCEKLDIEPPKGLKGKLLLEKIENKSHPKKRKKRKIPAPQKKRKRGRSRKSDNIG
jgi:hypothetical protein